MSETHRGQREGAYVRDGSLIKELNKVIDVGDGYPISVLGKLRVQLDQSWVTDPNKR